MTDEPLGCLICHHRQPYDGHVCGPCVIREMTRLGEIPMLYALLPSALDVNPVTIIDLTYPPVGGARSTVAVHDEPGRRDQGGDIPVAAMLDSWVRDWHETLGYGSPPKAPTVSRLVNWLQIHLASACKEHDAIDEYAREIRGLAASMRRAINREMAPVRYEAPCPYCATKTLKREPGGDWIECGDCGRLWGEDEYGLLARAAIHEDILLTAEEAAVVARVEVGTIRVWAHRGKLTAEYVEPSTRPWYRKGDVERISDTRVNLT